jgi:hypothetical protein
MKSNMGSPRAHRPAKRTGALQRFGRISTGCGCSQKQKCFRPASDAVFFCPTRIEIHHVQRD